MSFCLSVRLSLTRQVEINVSMKVQGMFRECVGNVQGRVREGSRKVQGKFWEGSGKVPEFLKSFKISSSEQLTRISQCLFLR